MGIRGSSTCPIILNDCKVPAENLLGEIGRGAVIAFNILNIGRFKLGAMCGRRTGVAGKRHRLRQAAQSFRQAISDFGLVREKNREHGNPALRRRIAGVSPLSG